MKKFFKSAVAMLSAVSMLWACACKEETGEPTPNEVETKNEL